MRSDVFGIGILSHTLVDNTRVELHCHRRADNLAQETRRVAGVVCCWGGGVGAVGGGCGHFVSDSFSFSVKRVRVCFKSQLIEDMWCSLGYAVDDASPPDPNLESAVGKRDFLFATRALTDCGAELRQDSVAMKVKATTSISRK